MLETVFSRFERKMSNGEGKYVNWREKGFIFTFIVKKKK